MGPLALVLLGVFLSLVIVEILLRIFYPQYGGEPFQFDPVLGFSLKPDYDGIWRDHENLTPLRTNSMGFRDAEILVPKPRGVFRILVLGDSMTFGMGVEQEATFPDLLEEMLTGNRKAGQVRFEVINAGVPGYGTAQQLLQYRLYKQQLNPDLVILAFFVSNDLLDNLCVDQIRPDRTSAPTNPARPCFALRNEKLTEVHSPQPPQGTPPLSFLNVKKLHTWLFFHSSVKNTLTSRVEVIEFLHNLSIDIPIDQLPGTFSWYMEEYRSGWPLTVALFDDLKEEISRDRDSLIVVAFPSRPQVTDQILQLTHVLFADFEETEEFMTDITRPQELLTRWGEEEQIPVIDCLPDLKKAARTQPIYLPDGHFNATAHKIVAELIFNHLTQNELTLPGGISETTP